MPTFNQLVRKRAQAATLEDRQPGAAELSAEARRLYARLHFDPEEAEFGAAESGPRPADQRDRSDYLHSRRGAQPAGTLDRADPRRPREGSSRRALSRDSRRAGHGGRRQSQAGPLQVRRQEAKVVE